MNPILIQIQEYLDRSNREVVNMPEQFIEEFGELCKAALRKQFNNKRNEKFTLRMSNAGRPLCQLQMEAAGVKGIKQPYYVKVRNLIGDMVEALTITLMKSSGVDVKATDQKVGLKIGGIFLEGSYDVKVDGIYDVKSASPFSFDNKFKRGFKALYDEDAFGYAAQGYGYGAADGSPFKGWIVTNKVTGEMCVTETPPDEAGYKEETLAKIDRNIRALNDKRPFERCYEDVAEHFYKKETGNRHLGFVCANCEFKLTCWPGVQLQAQPDSKAQNPRKFWYTKYTGKAPANNEVAGDVREE